VEPFRVLRSIGRLKYRSRLEPVVKHSSLFCPSISYEEIFFIVLTLVVQAFTRLYEQKYFETTKSLDKTHKLFNFLTNV
jgi:hypothetical protein